MRCLVASLAGGRGANSTSKQYRSIRYFVSRRWPPSGKAGRRGVCRVTYEGQLVGRASTFENLAKRKQAGLKVRSASQPVRCMVLRCNRQMAIKPGDQIVLNTMRLHCRRIGWPVERSPNHDQAQQTCHDLDFHSLMSRPVIRRQSVLLAVIPVRRFRLRSGCVRLAQAAKTLSPLVSMRNTP